MTVPDQDRLNAETFCKFMEAEGWVFESSNSHYWKISLRSHPGSYPIASSRTKWTRETIAPVLAKMTPNMILCILDRLSCPDFVVEGAVNIELVNLARFIAVKAALKIILADGPTLARACAAAIRKRGDGK